MPNLLVVYASTHGHTAKIAGRVADVLRADGATVTLEPVSADPAPDDYDAVVAGASIHAGHHQREIVRWARGNRARLARRPVGVLHRLPDGRRRHGGVTRGDPRLPRRVHRGGGLDAEIARPRSPARCSTASTTSTPACSSAC